MGTKNETSISKSKEKRSFGETLKSLSVEPAGFFVILSVVVSYLIFQNLQMETICRVDLQYPEDMCREIINKVVPIPCHAIHDLEKSPMNSKIKRQLDFALNGTFKEQEQAIQKFAAGVQAFTSVIFSTVTVLVVLFIGPWSDINGRKIPLLLSVSGLMIFSLTMLTCYLLMGKITALQLTLGAMLPVTICGGGVVFTMSAYSYLSDTTSPKMRTVRTGILSASIRSGTPFGFAIGGAMTKLGVGTMPSLLVAFGFALIAFLIVLFTVKNASPAELNRRREDPNGEPIVTQKVEQTNCQKYNPLNKLIEAFGILVKPRPNRGTFFLLIATFICYAAPGSGEHSMLYLFVRQRLGWNISNFGFFSMYNWLMSAAGVVLSMYILSKTLKISDPVVGFVAGISQIGGSTMYAFTTTPVMMYISSAMDMMNGTIGVIVRSMLSKCVRPDEVGKLFAFLGVLESLLPLLMVPTYAMVYRSTISTFAGCFFLLSAGVTLPAEIIFLYFMCKKEQNEPDVVYELPETPKEEEMNGKVISNGVPELTKLVEEQEKY